MGYGILLHELPIVVVLITQSNNQRVGTIQSLSSQTLCAKDATYISSSHEIAKFACREVRNLSCEVIPLTHSAPWLSIPGIFRSAFLKAALIMVQMIKIQDSDLVFKGSSNEFIWILVFYIIWEILHLTSLKVKVKIPRMECLEGCSNNQNTIFSCWTIFMSKISDNVIIRNGKMTVCPDWGRLLELKLTICTH